MARSNVGVLHPSCADLVVELAEVWAVGWNASKLAFAALE
jgi:hypothetical protein